LIRPFSADAHFRIPSDFRNDRRFFPLRRTRSVDTINVISRISEFLFPDARPSFCDDDIRSAFYFRSLEACNAEVSGALAGAKRREGVR
jgi:hypothetical protein